MRVTGVRQFYTLLKWSFVIMVVMITTVFLMSSNVGVQDVGKNVYEQISQVINEPMPSPTKNWRDLSEKQINSLSVLGRYLFLDEVPPPQPTPEKNYKILVWKMGQFLERRHIYHFTSEKFDPFAKCSVRNCELTYQDDALAEADAVLIHMQRLKGVQDLPQEKGPRPENQRWVFLTDENPIFTFMNPNVKMQDFNGKFNWSMNYRIEADVPVPYGRTVLKNNDIETNDLKDEKIFPKRSDVLVAVMGSNCGGRNHRWQYVKELQKYINVDFYGQCGTLKCPGHFSKDCDAISNYKFYLSFENSNCAQYITEKLWWNAYAKNSIPVVMGASKLDYKQFLPPKSYINVEDFARPIDLARYILYVNKTNDNYQKYFEWKKYYRISNEHGYFQTDSYHYCRLCEALNYNSKDKKVYNKLEKFWTTKDCYSRWDENDE